jgi:hypothetical protein
LASIAGIERNRRFDALLLEPAGCERAQRIQA